MLLFLLIGLYAGGSPGMFVVLDLVRMPLSRTLNTTDAGPAATHQLSPVIVSSSPSFTPEADFTTTAKGIVFFSVINRVLRGVSHGDHPTALDTRSMQFNAPSSRTALSGTTDSSRSFGGGGVPVSLRAHTREKEKGKEVVPGSPYSLEMPDMAKPMTFAASEV